MYDLQKFDGHIHCTSGDAGITASYSFNPPPPPHPPLRFHLTVAGQIGQSLWSCKVGLVDVKDLLPQFRKRLRSCERTGVLISFLPDLLHEVFCLMVRIFRLMIVFLYINSISIPPIMMINT